MKLELKDDLAAALSSVGIAAVGHAGAGAGAEAGGTVEGTVATADGVAQPSPDFAAVLCSPYRLYSARTAAASAC